MSNKNCILMYPIPFSTTEGPRPVHQNGEAYMLWDPDQQTGILQGKTYDMKNPTAYTLTKQETYPIPKQYYLKHVQGEDSEEALTVVFNVHNSGLKCVSFVMKSREG
jgi:hypothetical protein